MSSAPTWWTAADAAELDVAIWEFVSAAWAHRSCVNCRDLGAWCPPLREAGEAVLDWRRGRQLLSRAQYLRAQETETT